MLTVLEQSVKGRKLKGFRSFHFGSSNNQPNKLTKTFWLLEVGVRKATFLKYMKMKALMGLCDALELRMLYDLPGVLEDDLFLDALRAARVETDLELLFDRIATMQKFLMQDQWSINLYYTLDGVVSYRISENRVTIRKGKKFSGYVRNSSAVGSKRGSNNSIPEPESFEWREDVKIDFFKFFSVGEFSSDTSGNCPLTLMMIGRSKRRNPKTRPKT